MIDDKVPQSLYKYRYCDQDGYYKSLLKDNNLFFSSPKRFNDPFDCLIYPNYESGTKEDITNKFLEIIKITNPSLSKNRQKIIAKDSYHKNIGIMKSPTLLTERVNNVINNYFGIFSLSERVDSLLMWAHYSDCHKGFCLEFDANKLSQICRNYSLINELILVKKINYALKYPFSNPYKSKIDYTDFINWIITKSKDWEYEQEWRLIYTKHPDENILFPENIITGIYFGVNATAMTINNVIDLFIKKKNIPIFYKAKLKHREFGITFDLLKV